MTVKKFLSWLPAFFKISGKYPKLTVKTAQSYWRIWIHFLVWAEILIFSIGLSEIGLLCDILGRVFSRPWHKSYSKSVKLKVGHVYGALETCAWLGIHINSELFLFLFFEYFVQKKIAWRKSRGAIAPSAPPSVVGPVYQWVTGDPKIISRTENAKNIGPTPITIILEQK